ncbi:DUF421 domain-containing protein [Janthinobacterium sp. DSP2-3-3]|uniref:DUF421 domain-containing protein n=1 Tax=unclassified Janthinobacterium TaxID=2610881 RepID=UPI003CE69F15
MFDLDLPAWELVARAVMVYLALLLMVRMTGKRTVGQFTPFDLLVVMLLSEAVSNSLSGGDDSISGGLILALTLICLNMLIAWITSRSRKLAELVDGTPVLLGRDGVIFNDVVKKCRVASGDVEQALREADCPLPDMKCAFLEADGKITILQK